MAVRAEPVRLPGAVVPRPRRELDHDRRPQADRDPLPRHVPALLRRSAGSSRCSCGRSSRRERELPVVPQLYNEVFTMHGTDDGLPRRRPDPGRVRQLPRAADDRRKDMAFPRLNALLVLAVPVRRDRALRELLRRGRRRADRLDGYPPLSEQYSRATAWTSGSSSLHILTIVVARRRDQLHRDDPPHAHARDDVDAPAALRLVDRRLRLHARSSSCPRSRPG